MTPTQFNLTNQPNCHCYAVYTDRNTGLIERSLIVSPVLYDKLDGFKVPYLIVRVEAGNFDKVIKLRDLTTIIVTSIQWTQGDKIDHSQRTSL